MKRSILLPLLCLLSYNATALRFVDKLSDNIRENDLFLTKVLCSDDNQFFVEVSTKDLIIKETSLFGERYSYINSVDCHTNNIEGNPALPLYTQSIALPDFSCQLHSTSVEELEWDTIKVGRLMPNQPSFIEGKEAKELTINRALYEGGWYRPKRVQTTDIQIFRGIKNTNVRVCPFDYNAVSGKLAVLRKFRIKVSFEKNHKNKNASFAPNYYHYLFNNTDVPSDIPALSLRNYQGNYDYLIIVGDIPNVIDSEILKEFRLWKALKGIRTKVVTTDSTGLTDTSIKAYIQSQYASDSIKYVLLIGKAHHIPQHIMSRFTDHRKLLRSDYWYGCMDGENDLEADIAIGRYSVNFLQELENAMRKTIRYEMGTNAEGRKALLVAHQENAGQLNSFQACMEDISNDSQNSNFTFIKEYGASIANGGTRATSESVARRINQEVGIFNYREHAGPFFWKGDWSIQSRPLFDSLMISTFTNEKYPIALSIACETGRIDSTGTCLMDLYMNGVHGISSGIGSTSDSWHYENNWYNKFLYKMINSANEGLGFININAHTLCLSTPNSFYKDNTFSYCCFGDPSLRVWTDSIKMFPTPSIEITSSSINISVGNITDYEIIIASESNGLIASYHSTSNNYTIPLPSVSCTIAIHKSNFKSYLFDYISTNYVQNKSIKRRTLTSSSPIVIGNNVTTEKPSGNVVIEDGGILQIKQNSEVSIPNGFECKLGGQLIIN